ncbi:MAG: efflux RND transporter periplasmic adaptor subunit [Acidobacteriaceae bacterium]|nr:efflux RND transporter periplasmic adaptor subunit [Acidobacteriaceae bacterium]
MRQESIHEAANVVGTLAAIDEVTISSQVEGTVSRIAVDLGDRIQAGQVLVELDREKLQYNVEQQQAMLASALAKYGASHEGDLPPVENTPDVQKAAAELVQAKQAADRASELHRRQLVPKQTLDDADATFRSKQASYDSAVQGSRNLSADIQSASAGLKLAERQLRDAAITAPFDGFVEKRIVSLGEFVKNQAPVMSIVRVDPLKLTGEIPEGMAPWVQVGQDVQLLVDAYPDRPFTGKIARISPAVNPLTRAFPFEAMVPNHDALLKPGTFARAHFATSRMVDVLTIPYATIQYRYGVNRAFVVAGDKLQARELKIGDRLGDRIEVLSGLKDGDVLATTDVDNLTDGMSVSVKAQ